MLVAAAIFQLATGLPNSAAVVPVAFTFRATHYAVALDRDRRAARAHRGQAAGDPRRRSAPTSTADDATTGRSTTAVTRRGAGCVRPAWRRPRPSRSLTTAGSTVPWLRRVSVFGVRSGDGPAGHARSTSRRSAAGVTSTALDPAYRLTVVNGDREVSLTSRRPLARCRSAPTTADRLRRGLERAADWTGVRLRDLLTWSAHRRRRRRASSSLQERGPYRGHGPAARTSPTTTRTLLALSSTASRCRIDHGYPVPADRAGPARRAADQVGHPARGASMTADAVLRRRSPVSRARAVRRLCCCWPGWAEPGLDIAVWLAGGVVLHDGVLVRRDRSALPWWRPCCPRRPARAPVAVGLVVLGTVTLLADAGAGPVRRASGQPHPAGPQLRAPAGWSSLAIVVLRAVVASPSRSARARADGVWSRGSTCSSSTTTPPSARWWSPTCAPPATRCVEAARRRGGAQPGARATGPTWSCST